MSDQRNTLPDHQILRHHNHVRMLLTAQSEQLRPALRNLADNQPGPKARDYSTGPITGSGDSHDPLGLLDDPAVAARHELSEAIRDLAAAVKRVDALVRQWNPVEMTATDSADRAEALRKMAAENNPTCRACGAIGRLKDGLCATRCYYRWWRSGLSREAWLEHERHTGRATGSVARPEDRDPSTDADA